MVLTNVYSNEHPVRCQFVKDETPWKQSFNATVQVAKDAWNT